MSVAVALATPGALLPVDNKEGSSKETGGKGGMSGNRSTSSPPVEPWSGRSNNSELDELTVEEMAAQQLKDNVMKSKNLDNALHTVERAVMQNMYHAKQLRYRGLPNAVDVPSSHSIDINANNVNSGGERNRDYIPPPSPMSPMQEVGSPNSPSTGAYAEGGATSAAVGGNQIGDQVNNEGCVSDAGGEKSRLLPLFDFMCFETRGRTIHTMSFNKANSDVLAVAYGNKVTTNRASTPHSATAIQGGGSVEDKVKDVKDDGGLVAFWSLRNPQ